jgi:hypothetical protein
MNTTQRLYICSDGLNDDSFVPGQCVAPPCDVCSACLTFANWFTSQQVSNSTDGAVLSASFLAACGAANIPSVKCQATAAAINGSVVLGRRAGALCRHLQLCDPVLPSNCSLSVAFNPSLSVSAPQLDLCTVEGVPSGSQVPGVVLPGWLPEGGCWNDTTCGSPDLRCDKAGNNSLSLRSCTLGVDSTAMAGRCVATECAVCRQCVQTMLDSFVLPQRYANASMAAAAFNTTCMSLPGAVSSKCMAVASAVSTLSNSTLRQRAGALCAALGADGGCSGSVVSSPACQASVVVGSGRLNGSLDLCSVEGVVGGSLPEDMLPPNGEQHGQCTSFLMLPSTTCCSHPALASTCLTHLV